MPVFQPMVEAVKEGSWLALWNSETHSLLGCSHREEIKLGICISLSTLRGTGIAS
ncbi:hypothetical protein [Echinicola strongylocentroti]|uniref:hypothetical protein n=1 Tax=Echinicola strongylocentroti TaxID=1795355 RepID=UPI0013A6F3A4|nr:hypothetical protein [Echinicola strongylocentroti]